MTPLEVSRLSDLALRPALNDLQIVALTLFGEARGEPIEGIVAVGSIIRNRALKSPQFGNNFRGVCLRKWQFSCWLPQGGQTNYDLVMAAARSLLIGNVTGPALKECLWVAGGLLEGSLRDNVRGADHYYAPKAMSPRGRVPSWAQGKEPVIVIGPHRFYRLG
jgi:N-acetylmuramoyl-L-alanine amidase